MGFIGSSLAAAINAVIAGLYKALVYPFTKNLYTVQQLIFGNNNLDFKTFHPTEITNAYDPGIHIMYILAGFFILSAIIIGGMRVSYSGLSPSGRSTAIDFGKDILIVTVALMNLGFIYTFLFYLNDTFVSFFNAANNASAPTFKDSISTGQGFLGEIIIQLALLGLSIWANFYYMMRKLTLLILMILGPVMLAMWMIPQFKKVTTAWLSQLTGTIFIQSIQSLVFFIVMIVSSGEKDNFIAQTILLIIFIPVAESVRGLLGLGGDMHSKLSMAGAAFGMSALAGVTGAVKGAISGESTGSTLGKLGKRALNGAQNGNSKGQSDDENSVKGSPAANSGTDSSSTPTAEKMLRAGEFVSKMGKAVVGSAGAIAGSTMGPTGTLAGGIIGFEAGNIAGGFAGRAGAAGIQGIGNRIKKGMEGSQKAFAKGEQKEEESLAGDLAEAESESWAAANKTAFANDLKKRFPDISDDEIDQKFNNLMDSKQSSFRKSANQTIAQIKSADGNMAKASELAQNATKALTSAWANENKDQAIARMTEEHPSLTDAEKEEKWSEMVQNKEKHFAQSASTVAQNMSRGVDVSKASISKEDYGKSLASHISSEEKKNFKLSPDAKGLSDAEVEVEFQKQQGGQQKMYATAISNGVNSTASESLISKGHINREHAASMIAAMKTDDMRLNYVSSLMKKGMSGDDASKQWESTGQSEAYSNNYQQAMSNITQSLPTNKAILPNNVAVSGAKAVSGFISGATGFGTVKDIVQQAPHGGLASYTHSVARGDSQVKSAWNAVRGTTSVVTDHTLGETPIDKHQSVVRGTSYASGVVFGSRGYQKTANFMGNHNPFNKGVQEQAKEVNEIMQMAPTTVDSRTGETQFVPGTVQMITTRDQSFIQARTKTGQTQIVSRYGSGNPSIPKGQQVYQDLQLQNGSLAPTIIQGKTSAYTTDTSGGKIPFMQQVNVNPNKLISANRPKSPQPAQVTTYNHQVDSGQLFLDKIKSNVSNIQMVTERNRSYMVGETTTGEKVRISPYKQGDTRLKTNEVVYTECEVINSRLTKTHHKKINQDIPNDNGRNLNWTSTLDPNEMIPPTRPNPRNQKRKDADRHRYNQGVN